jgi:hypothetical protein
MCKLGRKLLSSIILLATINSGAAVVEYTDSTFLKEKSADRLTLIYSWSPRMPLSLTGYSDAERFAREHDINFEPVADPDVSEAEIRKSLIKSHLNVRDVQQDHSILLQSVGTKLHFPSYVFVGGKLKEPHLVPGHKSEEAILKVLHGLKR